ncbi:extracellular solute-binding protein [Alicyclobacillus sacchari]|uniref:extracellular solute-binding protein n=1 Tax=Alicyclobacillus sacchari TaxID=392010 RepID=UPI0024E15FB7|nr:extracellular solute-binding protein [Alicyclobacillus sacchari]
MSIQVITGNYLQALQPMLAAHNAPDIFYVDSSYAPTLEASGAIMPLDSYVKQNHVDLSDFRSNLLKAFTWKGHIYGIPKDMNTMALEYNPALLAKAGIKSPPKTWSEFDQDAIKLKAKGIVPLDMPIDVARYYPFIADMGGSYYNEAKDQATFTNKANDAGLTWFMKEMEEKNFVTPQDQGGSWAGIPFAQGKAAMALEGAWLVPSMQQTAPNLKYGIADFPSLNGKDANMLFTVAYEMSRTTQHPAEAAKLLFFMTGKQALKMTADSGLAIPSRTSEQGEFLKKYPSYKGFVDGLKGAIPYQFGTLGQNFLDAINNATQQGILQKESAAQVLSQAQQTLNSQMND